MKKLFAGIIASVVSDMTEEEWKEYLIPEEKLAQLSPEERVIVEARQKDMVERVTMLDKLKHTKDPDVHQQVYDYLLDSTKEFCEHNRSLYKSCIACDEIDRKLFPESYDENGDLIADIS